MKSSLFFLLLVLQISLVTAQTSSDTILLQPEFGKEYTYEYTESKYIQLDNGKRLIPLDKIKTLRIKYEKAQPDNKELLFVTIDKNVAVRPNENPVRIIDYKFPEFVDGYYEQSLPDYYESLFCQITFKYEFDFNTSKIKLVNRDEILIKVNEILIEKSFDETAKRRQIRLFEEDAIDLMTNIVQFIYRVPNNLVNLGNNNFNEYDTKTESLMPNTKYTQKRDYLKVGQYSCNIEFNNETQTLINYNIILVDSLDRRIRDEDNMFHYFINYETDISLKSIRDVGSDNISIAGIIKNCKNKKVTIAWLKKPFGTTLSKQSILLDENNTFQFETELKHPQILYIQIGNGYTGNTPPMIPLYAEPGSKMELEANVESPSIQVHFSGDFQHANEMMNEFRIKHPIFKERFQDNSLTWSPYSIPNKEFINALKDLSGHFESCKTRVDKNAWEFIKLETEAQLMNSVVYKLRMYNISNTSIFAYFPSEDNESDIDFFEKKLNSFNIDIVYNPYGIQSREFVKNYVDYRFFQTRRTSSNGFLDFSGTTEFGDFSFLNDINLETEFPKTILAGPSLYQMLADNLFFQKKSSSESNSLSDNYEQNRAIEYFRLMLRLSNDEELNQEIKNIISTHLKWQNEQYVPDTKFLNPEGKGVYLKDFFGKKPTIFYISRDWSVERYYFDDLSVGNPEINYVLIVEGSNFTEWTNYLKEAHPKAFQLLLMDNTQHLPDIFSVTYQSFILYDENGIRLGYGTNPLNATQLVKEYLKTPKEKQLNKSQLQLIIFILIVALLLMIAGLMIWKWQVRKQFRKEEQKRELRELELTAIRSQMNPHFLFNSLNSVQNLIQQNKGREAHLYLSDFAGLIRKVLNNSEKEEISLAEELETVQQYLNLEKLRFDFDYQINILQDIDLHNTLVPSMLLQPLVENAIIHGLQNKENNRQLKIQIEKMESAIKISVEDNGIGRTAAAKILKEKNGKGSKLIKERLDILSQKLGEKYSLQTIDLEEGTRVEMIIPEEK